MKNTQPMKDFFIRTALLQVIIAAGMSVREYNDIKQQVGLDYQQEKDLDMVRFKLRMYKMCEPKQITQE
jgi:hypothetical protein